mmetsp:Transcript_31804/g.40851  ORF Transcript_31804/g.40851 Transcript_31804/m.40851 type:complete len:81 (+) Transcript_31804:439-681(+)
MSCYSTNGRTSNNKVFTLLFELNQLGYEGCLAFKKVLAHYVGVQLGDPRWWEGVQKVFDELLMNQTQTQVYEPDQEGNIT